MTRPVLLFCEFSSRDEAERFIAAYEGRPVEPTHLRRVALRPNWAEARRRREIVSGAVARMGGRPFRSRDVRKLIPEVNQFFVAECLMRLAAEGSLDLLEKSRRPGVGHLYRLKSAAGARECL